MNLVIAELLLSFPFLHVTLDKPESLLLLQVNSDRNLLAAHIQFNQFSLPYLLLLLRTQFNVVHLLHILQTLLQFYVCDTPVNDGFCFRIKLQILLSLFTVYVDRLLYYLTSGQAFSLLLSEIENLVTFPVQFGTYRIGNQSRSTILSVVICSFIGMVMMLPFLALMDTCMMGVTSPAISFSFTSMGKLSAFSRLIPSIASFSYGNKSD